MSSSRVNFILKKPSHGRKTFSILKREFKNEKAKCKVLRIESVAAVNKSLLSGVQDESQCEQSLKEIIKQLYIEQESRFPRVVYNSQNRQLLEKYWNAEYADRDLVDVDTAKNDLKRAVDAVGALSLYSSTKEDIQKELKRNVSGNTQRRVVMRLNQLLKWVGRDIKLRKEKKVTNEVRHISIDELKQLLLHIEHPEIKLLIQAAFYTGARLGELFALSPTSYRGKMLLIAHQIDRTGVRRETKRRDKRKSFIIPAGASAVEQWCNRKFKIERVQKFANITRQACKKAFPDIPEKCLVFHDLRHSYAIHLINKGISISLVAQSLGNSVTVCQEHYAGFSLSDDSIDAISKSYSE